MLLVSVFDNYNNPVFVYFLYISFPGVPDEIHEENGIKFQFQVFKKEA